MKHVSKIYTSLKATQDGNVLIDQPLAIQEEWTWDGDKVSTRKHYRPNGELRYTSHYFYTDGKLTKVEDHYEELGDNYRLDIEYNENGKVASTREYANDTLFHTYVFEYNGSNKFSGYTYTHTSFGVSNSTTYKAEWTGNNLTKVYVEGEEPTVYTYDNHPNPYHGVIESGRVYIWASENYNASVDGNVREISYDEDGWPIKEIFNANVSGLDMSTTTVYEY